MIAEVAGGIALATWLYLAIGRGRFWRTSIRLPAPTTTEPQRSPSVVAVVPARDEAAMLAHTLPSLLAQRYPGTFAVIVVDDDSTDATAQVAADAGVDVVRVDGPPPGWTGKVAALAAGVRAAGRPDYLLFTDADIDYPPDAVARLVSAAGPRVLTSQMVRLRTQTRWERLIVPAFVYFFAQLYPFAWVNRPGRTAAAAGGCMLVDRAALERAGGLGAIRDAVIDDVALAHLLKPHGPIWLGLAPDVRSVRPYPRLADLWRMVARSAYTQLRCSPTLLLGTIAGLIVVYVLPPALAIGGAVAGAGGVALLGFVAWALMAATYLPMLRFYRVAWPSAFLLPAVAALYAAMTLDSARRHRLGRGAQWKGRAAAQ